jgi:hypothetical protein
MQAMSNKDNRLILSEAEGNNELCDLIPTATIAASACRLEETVNGVSVPMPTSKPTTGAKSSGACLELVDGNGHDGGCVMVNIPLNNSERNTGSFCNPSSYVRNCDNCGREYIARRHTSKYCGGACRLQAWLKNHPDITEARNTAYRERVKAAILARGGTSIDR